MEARLTAHAKGHLIKKVKDMVRDQLEYRDVESRLEEVTKEIQVKTLEFEKEAQELRTQVRNEFEFRRRVQEIQRRAEEALKPKYSEMSIIKANLETKRTACF